LFAGYLYDDSHILCPRTFLILDDGKFHALSFFQRSVTDTLDGAIVDKDVFSVVSGDKTIAFCVVEPLDDTGFSLCHEPLTSFLLSKSWIRAFQTGLTKGLLSERRLPTTVEKCVVSYT